MSEGFSRVDRIAKELANRPGPGPKPGRNVRRSTAARWAILGSLAATGIVGALFFVGSSGPRKRIPAPPVAAQPAVPVPSAPPMALAGGDRALRAAQIAVVLDDIDANLHALRLSWPGQKDSVVGWEWPAWMPLDHMNKELTALDEQLGAATDPLSNATRAWITMARTDGPRIHELVGLWHKPDSSVDAISAEVRPMFARMVATSQAVHAAVAADLAPPEHGTLAAVGTACRVAPMFARMPEVTFDEMQARSLACLDEARAFLAGHPVDRLDYHVTYQFGLATQTATNLLVEIGRRQDALKGSAYVSATGNLAHESTYLSAQRREYDASLRSVPAEAPPPSP